jgi:hypothetical protein
MVGLSYRWGWLMAIAGGLVTWDSLGPILGRNVYDAYGKRGKWVHGCGRELKQE